MSTNDTATGTPIDFDPEGNPMFERDALDARYSDLMDRMKAGADKSWFTIDQAVGELLAPTGAMAFAGELLEVAGELVERERGRVRLMVTEQKRRLEELRRGLPDVD